MTARIPKAKIGLIGGSGTWAARIPEDLGRRDVWVVRYYPEGFETPFGQTTAFKLLEIAGHPALRTPFHGWHLDNHTYPLLPWIWSKQVAWVFQQAGVEWALVEGSVGGIQNPNRPGEPLPPWSVVITSNFVMRWCPPIHTPFRGEGETVFRRMGEPFCAALRQVLLEEAEKESRFTVYDHGVYACTPPGRFETDAEIEDLLRSGCHIVGQTLGHEAPLMRQLGIHFASLNIVVNHAEGRGNWSETVGGMEKFYQKCAPPVANVIFSTARRVIEEGLGPCHCHDFATPRLGKFPVPNA